MKFASRIARAERVAAIGAAAILVADPYGGPDIRLAAIPWAWPRPVARPHSQEVP